MEDVEFGIPTIPLTLKSDSKRDELSAAFRELDFHPDPKVAWPMVQTDYIAKYKRWDKDNYILVSVEVWQHDRPN